MFNKLIMATCLLALTACDPFEGILSVKQKMTVKSTEQSPGCSPDGGGFISEGVCDQIVNVALPVGDQNAKLDFVSNYQIQMNLKVDGRTKYINLDLPQKLNIPDHGSFSISSQDLGQNFAARGNIVKVVTDSALQRGYESCTYTRREQVCQPINNQWVCRDEYRTVYGQQQVEFFVRSTNQKVSVNFVNENSSSVLANFSGERNFTDRIYTYKGQCY